MHAQAADLANTQDGEEEEAGDEEAGDEEAGDEQYEVRPALACHTCCGARHRSAASASGMLADVFCAGVRARPSCSWAPAHTPKDVKLCWVCREPGTC